MKKYIVLMTKGKHDSVDFCSVEFFDDLREADNFINNNRKTGKHWTWAEKIREGETVYLCSPSSEDRSLI